MPRGGRRPGAGRRPGSPTNFNKSGKEALLEALNDGQGATAYFLRLKKGSAQDRRTFTSLCGRLIPQEVSASLNLSADDTQRMLTCGLEELPFLDSDLKTQLARLGCSTSAGPCSQSECRRRTLPSWTWCSARFATGSSAEANRPRCVHLFRWEGCWYVGIEVRDLH